MILYNLTRRGPEFDLLPWLAARSIPVMAYSPVEQGRLLSNLRLREIADRKQVTPAQVALAWLLRQDGIIAVPKAGILDHVVDNRRAADLVLDEEDLGALDEAFPAPTQSTSLEML